MLSTTFSNSIYIKNTFFQPMDTVSLSGSIRLDLTSCNGSSQDISIASAPGGPVANGNTNAGRPASATIERVSSTVLLFSRGEKCCLKASFEGCKVFPRLTCFDLSLPLRGREKFAFMERAVRNSLRMESLVGEKLLVKNAQARCESLPLGIDCVGARMFGSLLIFSDLLLYTRSSLSLSKTLKTGDTQTEFQRPLSPPAFLQSSFPGPPCRRVYEKMGETYVPPFTN